jgi:hypothetical protein
MLSQCVNEVFSLSHHGAQQSTNTGCSEPKKSRKLESTISTKCLVACNKVENLVIAIVVVFLDDDDDDDDAMENPCTVTHWLPLFITPESMVSTQAKGK